MKIFSTLLKIADLHIKEREGERVPIFLIDILIERGEIMDTLNIIVRKYLEINGIRVGHFADYIGCEQSRCSRWLSGEGKLRPIHIKKVHEFLDGKFLKSVDDIIKKEGSYYKGKY